MTTVLPKATLDDFTIEPLERDRLDHLLPLLAAGFGRRFSRTRLRAKYDTSYLGLDPVGFLAYDRAGAAVGYYGLIPMRVVHGGHSWLAGQSADSVVLPRHQGRGLLSHLLKMTFARARSAGVSLVVGFANTDSARTFLPKYFQGACRLRGVLLPASRWPLARLWARLPMGQAAVAALSRRVLPLLAHDVVPRDWSAGLQGLSVERSAAYLAYKAGLGSVWVDAAGSPAWIKLSGGQLIVGEIVSEDRDQIVAALGALRAYARRTGHETVVYFAAEVPATLPAEWGARSLPDWSTHVADLSGAVPVDRCDFRASDIDTF